MACLLLVLSGKNGVPRTTTVFQHTAYFMHTFHFIIQNNEKACIQRSRFNKIIIFIFIKDTFKVEQAFFSHCKQTTVKNSTTISLVSLTLLYYRVNSFAHCCFWTINARIRVKKTMSPLLGKQFCLLGPKKGPWNLCPGVHGPHFENCYFREIETIPCDPGKFIKLFSISCIKKKR